MTKQFAIIFLLFLSNFGFSQDTTTYNYITLDEARTKDPATVLAIRITKQKLTKVPDEIMNYPNLRALDLSKNRISAIPIDLNKLEQLEVLILSKNRLESFPIVVCSMPNLRTLSVSNNPISTIPPCIEYSQKLEHLDIFNTLIADFPIELSALRDLKTLDARAIQYGPIYQANWIKLLPNTVIKFDLPCNCIE